MEYEASFRTLHSYRWSFWYWWCCFFFFITLQIMLNQLLTKSSGVGLARHAQKKPLVSIIDFRDWSPHRTFSSGFIFPFGYWIPWIMDFSLNLRLLSGTSTLLVLAYAIWPSWCVYLILLLLDFFIHHLPRNPCLVQTYDERDVAERVSWRRERTLLQCKYCKSNDFFICKSRLHTEF